jgi:WD40 repeat protein
VRLSFLFLFLFPFARAEVVVAIGGEKGIVSLWDVKSGRAKLSNTRVDESVVPNQTITALMYLPLGPSLIVWGLFLTRVSCRVSCRVRRSCPGAGQVVSVTSEQNIVFHDPQSLAPVKQLIGHNDEIIDVKYLHNGTHIVIATNSAQVLSFPSPFFLFSFRFVFHLGLGLGLV